MPFAVYALSNRLRFATELPSWAHYLPPDMHEEVHKQFQQDDLTASLENQVLLPVCAETVAEDEIMQPPCPEATQAWWYQKAWSLARDAKGCRDLQKALDNATSMGEIVAMAAEFNGHVSEALRCPHANFVVQKLISLLPPASVAFMFEELLSKGREGTVLVARHKYGCRIIQRLLATKLPTHVTKLIDHLLEDAITTCQHPYGNYVMQQVLDYCNSHQRRYLLEILGASASSLDPDFHISAVFVKAFAACSKDEQAKLARNLIKAPAMLQKIGSTRHGHQATRHVFKSLTGFEQDRAKMLIFGKGRTDPIRAQ